MARQIEYEMYQSLTARRGWLAPRWEGSDHRMDEKRTKNVKPPRDYLSRREQRRLLVLVMSVGLLVLMINEARKPENWSWLRGNSEPGQPATPDYSNYDTKYQPSPEEEYDPGVIRIVPRDPVPVTTDRSYFPGVEPALLGEVKDNMPYRPQESKPWYHLLGILKNNNASFLEKNSSGDVSFVQLFEQPNEYRGDLVSLHGVARRATEVEATSNSEGIDKFYKLILKLPEGAQRPIIVNVLELPEGFPVSREPSLKAGDDIREEVLLTGFFFKNVVYQAANQQDYIAPVLLAKQVTWKPAPIVKSRPIPQLSTIWLMIAGMAALATIVALFVYYRSKMMTLPKQYEESLKPSQHDFERLSNSSEIKSVDERLSEMAGGDMSGSDVSGSDIVERAE